MGIKFEGQVLKFGTVDKCNRKFAPDCKITFPEKIPVAYNFDMDEIIGHADISKVEDGLKGVVSFMGMTDNQYKGMLLDQLEDWQEVLDLAIKAGNTEIQEKVEKQIRKINEKLKF